jgi:hypothetical protein
MFSPTSFHIIGISQSRGLFSNQSYRCSGVPLVVSPMLSFRVCFLTLLLWDFYFLSKLSTTYIGSYAAAVFLSFFLSGGSDTCIYSQADDVIREAVGTGPTAAVNPPHLNAAPNIHINPLIAAATTYRDPTTFELILVDDGATRDFAIIQEQCGQKGNSKLMDACNALACNSLKQNKREMNCICRRQDESQACCFEGRTIPTKGPTR